MIEPEKSPVSRRRFLDYFLSGSFAAGMMAACAPVLRFLWPPKALESEPPTDLGLAAEIREGQAKPFVREGRACILVRRNSEFIALDAVCRHADCVVKWNAEAGALDCPCHGARFDLNGSIVKGPVKVPLAKLVVFQRDGRVFVSNPTA